MRLKKGFITNEEFIKLHNEIGPRAMAYKFGCAPASICNYRAKNIPEFNPKGKSHATCPTVNKGFKKR